MRAALVCAALASACTVGPDYRAPELEVPEAWSGPEAGARADTSAIHSDPAAAELSCWWTAFGDATLSSLVERAALANPDLRMARARVLEARALSGLARSERGLAGGLSGSYARARISENEPVLGSLAPIGAIPFENDVFEVGFDASWELDVFGGQRRAIEAAAAELEASEAERQAVLVSLLAEVSRDYVELRALQRRIAIARDNLALQADALAIAELRFEGGLTNELDATRAAALLASTQAQIPALEAREASAMHRLAILIGRPPAALSAELATTAPAPVVPPHVPLGLPADLLRRRPDVRRAERQLAAATARVGVEVAELYPRFSLNGELGLRSTELDTLTSSDSRFFSVGPRVQWRLFERARIRARIDARDARQAQALAAFEKALLAALGDVEDALWACDRERARQALIERQVELDRRSVETASVLYGAGRVSFLEVLDAQRALFAGEDLLAQSEQALAEGVIALYKGLGGGWEAFEPGAEPRAGAGAPPGAESEP